MVGIYGHITEYMGTAYTGKGVMHKYEELLEESRKTIFLKCLPTHSLSQVLNDLAVYFVKRGHPVDRFMNPGHTDKTDAIYVNELKLFILQASHPISFEPTDLGGRHKVFCFYDVYHQEHLYQQHEEVGDLLKQEKYSFGKSLAALENAKEIHDEWEAVNIQRMDWDRHTALTEQLKEGIFGTIELAKTADISHRIIGSLSAGKAHDFIPSITKRMRRRLLIKGLAGTGKSTMMRALGEEAANRGIDVLYGWCGLDPSSIDLVLFPELSVCLFDSTKPHAYDPESPRDELVDLVPFCAEDQQAEKLIEDISRRYAEAIADASGYMQTAMKAQNAARVQMDRSLNVEVFEKKLQTLYALIKAMDGN
ncbi:MULTISPECIES: hypothetical protein [Sporosarcina]|uniref:hypothetical protein n=1 Tax=Sporosarcina TaxID=1569 RepID=UPI00129AB77C|nr:MULTISPECIES: hypothetical protein [Sporosarcina]GKV67373.1 hypothetical protein NCCP2331_35260 [Sporosarcina sp. NCCP-2331]GLB57729.1 hypothetical protein NCCP2378_35190 [Sporosarcina sp. NCCP-2378]